MSSHLVSNCSRRNSLGLMLGVAFAVALGFADYFSIQPSAESAAVTSNSPVPKDVDSSSTIPIVDSTSMPAISSEEADPYASYHSCQSMSPDPSSVVSTTPSVDPNRTGPNK
jgi:hypothetical protein